MNKLIVHELTGDRREINPAGKWEDVEPIVSTLLPRLTDIEYYTYTERKDNKTVYMYKITFDFHSSVNTWELYALAFSYNTKQNYWCIWENDKNYDTGEYIGHILDKATTLWSGIVAILNLRKHSLTVNTSDVSSVLDIIHPTKKIIRPAVEINYSQLKGAKNIEDILCLATLTATMALPYNASLDDAREYFKTVAKESCDNCSFVNGCLASSINE